MRGFVLLSAALAIISSGSSAIRVDVGDQSRQGSSGPGNPGRRDPYDAINQGQFRSILAQRTNNQGNGNQGLSSYGNEGINGNWNERQGNGNQGLSSYGNEAINGNWNERQGNGNQGLGSYGNEGSKVNWNERQQNGNQGLGSYSNEGSKENGREGQSYSQSEGSNDANKGYGNVDQGYGQEGYGNEGYGNEGYGNEGYGNEGYFYNGYDLDKYLQDFGALGGDYWNGYRGPQGRGRFGLGFDHRTLFADSLRYPITPESYKTVGRGFYRSFSLASPQGV